MPLPLVFPLAPWVSTDASLQSQFSGFSNDGADGRGMRGDQCIAPLVHLQLTNMPSHLPPQEKTKLSSWPHLQLAPYFSVLFHSTIPKKNSLQSVHFPALLLLSQIPCNSSVVPSTPLNWSRTQWSDSLFSQSLVPLLPPYLFPVHPSPETTVSMGGRLHPSAAALCYPRHQELCLELSRFPANICWLSDKRNL